MATLLLQSAGAAIGGLLGGPLGALAGQALGGLAGSYIDGRVLSALTPRKNVTGPRLKSLDGIASTEGSAITRVYGRARVGGQMIWATRFEETVIVERAGGKGGKGGAVGRGGGGGKNVTYKYAANFAIGF